MKIYLTPFITTILFFFFFGNRTAAQDIAAGKGSFTNSCAACHTVGKGRLVGPDLANIDQRKPEEWIIQFVKSSQTVIKSGDAYADSLFKAFNNVIMPDQPTLSDLQIKDIISYIKDKSATPGAGNVQQSANQNTVQKAGSFFSTTTILLLCLIGLMLLVIFSLARINKTLLDQIKDYYSSDRSFFK